MMEINFWNSMIHLPSKGKIGALPWRSEKTVNSFRAVSEADLVYYSPVPIRVPNIQHLLQKKKKKAKKTQNWR